MLKGRRESHSPQALAAHVCCHSSQPAILPGALPKPHVVPQHFPTGLAHPHICDSIRGMSLPSTPPLLPSPAPVPALGEPANWPPVGSWLTALSSLTINVNRSQLGQTRLSFPCTLCAIRPGPGETGSKTAGTKRELRVLVSTCQSLLS